MEFDHKHYIPCLKWKQGEYQAISRFDSSIKNYFTPLIEVPEIGWDFEEKRNIRTLEEHLMLFTKRVIKKWGKAPCIIDTRYILSTGKIEESVQTIRFIFNKLRENCCYAIPTIHLDNDNEYKEEIRNIIKENEEELCLLKEDKEDLCLRLSLEQASKEKLKKDIDIMLEKLKIQLNKIHLILDMDAPNYIPLEGFAKLIKKIIYNLPYLNEWRTFSILGTSIPKTMSEIKKGVKILDRYEWIFYKRIIEDFEKENSRLPTFSDYGIYHPNILLPRDMRQINSSANIKYTINDKWFIVKGRGIKVEGGLDLEQFRDLSKTIISTQYYYGSNFSFGDDYIEKCANGKTKTPGSLTRWIQVCTNHHIQKVIKDIANYYAS